jgi:hypothetical protein
MSRFQSSIARKSLSLGGLILYHAFEIVQLSPENSLVTTNMRPRKTAGSSRMLQRL